MSRPSYHRVNYRLRPAKNIERKMFGEVFARLNGIAPMQDYRYVGFGSTFFNDFSMYHQSLGITDMVSIEGQVSESPRFEFNRPIKSIKVKWGRSGEVLEELSWKKRAIIWLDYDSSLDSAILEDIHFVVGAARSGSVIIVTVDAEPLKPSEGRGQGGDGIHARRLNRLRESVDSVMIPAKLKGSELAGWGTAGVYRKIINNKIGESLAARNAPLEKADRIKYEQCFYFWYADGAKMLSLGGLLLDEADRRRLGRDGLAGLEFVRKSSRPFHIDPPILTSREVRYLNRRLPLRSGRLKYPKWLSRKDRDRYAAIYRYYPVFAESEL